jgi:hypothetical protein
MSTSKKYKNSFKNWLNDEWIHPQLQESKPIKYEAFLLPITINKNILKNNYNPTV